MRISFRVITVGSREDFSGRIVHAPKKTPIKKATTAEK
jgi:hypothetical protein